MEKFKRSAFLIVMGTAILLFMSGCGMKKRAAGMSGESLSQEDIGLGNSGLDFLPELPAFVFSPELPPQPRELPEKTMASDETGIPFEAPLEMTSVTESSFDPGPTGYEGVDFTRGLSSIDFLPELPPQPNLAGGKSQELFREETIMAEAEKFAQEGKLQGNGYPMVLLDDFFEYDSWRLTNEAKRALEANAKWIKANSSQNLIIEGHCDERGAESYNVKLGWKRANVTRNYLIDLGVDSSRMKTVSYGESRPFCVEKNEDCYQKNRRVHFVVAS